MEKVKEKFQRVLDHKYVEIIDIQFIELLMYIFYILKGKDDIQIVLDGKKSGLNEFLYAPWFALPKVDSISIWIDAGSWLNNGDYCDIIMNFPLYSELNFYLCSWSVATLIIIKL